MTQDTRQLILDKSETLVRSRGYAAFSYGDLARDMGITKASVHYHFAAKEDLVLAILRRCIARGRDALAQLHADHADVRDRLRAYANIYLFSIEGGMLPICAALAAERAALPPSTYPLLTEFFQDQLDWLAQAVRDGIAADVLAPPQPPETAALVLYSALEGGAMIGWGMDRSTMVLAAFEAVLDCMQAPVAVGKRTPERQGGTRKRATSRSAAQAGGPRT